MNENNNISFKSDPNTEPSTQPVSKRRPDDDNDGFFLGPDVNNSVDDDNRDKELPDISNLIPGVDLPESDEAKKKKEEAELLEKQKKEEQVKKEAELKEKRRKKAQEIRKREERKRRIILLSIIGVITIITIILIIQLLMNK